jgi:hypothetical protein
MRSALVSRRNTSEAFVGLLAIAIVGMVGVVFGFMWGASQRQAAYRCPTVEGGKVAVTYDGKDGQRCVYIRETYGAAKIVAKL